MATTTSPAAIRAVIIDGPETGQIITLDGASATLPDANSLSASDLVSRIESRISRINSKAQEMLQEVRQINANLKENDS